MRVIFLDIDGVLNSPCYFKKCLEDGRKDAYQYTFDPDCVKYLNMITDTTGAKIVISSSWRKTSTIEELKKKFNEQGVTGEIIDFTPKTDLPRGQEIVNWLEGNSHIEGFVILDDNADAITSYFVGMMVQTSWSRGLSYENVFKSLEILAKNYWPN